MGKSGGDPAAAVVPGVSAGRSRLCNGLGEHTPMHTEQEGAAHVAPRVAVREKEKRALHWLSPLTFW